MKSIVICGSSRFTPEIREFAEQLENMGVTVFKPHFYRASGGVWDDLKQCDRQFVALGLTHDHFQKIRMADVVFVYNKDGYAGVGTTLEIGFAVAMNKPIYALSDSDTEICRKVLFSGFVKEPKDLLERLK